jgi:alpha-L-fucosidase
MTMNDHWSYDPSDLNWTPAGGLIANLVRCASRNGNYLLNVGPHPDGRFPPEAVVRLRQTGRWMACNGESVRETDFTSSRRIGPVQTPVTVKGNTLYVHVRHWQGRDLALGNPASRVLSARLLDGGRRAEFRQQGSRVSLSGLPQYAPDPYDTVIAIECDGAPSQIDRFS